MASRQAWSPWPEDPDRFLADADWHNVEDHWDFGILDQDNWDSSSHAHDDFFLNNPLLSSPDALQDRSLPSQHSLLSSQRPSPSPHHVSADIPLTTSVPSDLQQTSGTNDQSHPVQHEGRASRVSEGSARVGDHTSAASLALFGYFTDNLWSNDTPSTTTPTNSGPVGAETGGNDMVPRVQSGLRNSHSRVVDLTGDSSPPSTQKRKRRGSHSATSDDGRATKRGKIRGADGEDVIEAIDLSNDQEGSSAAESILRSQQQAAIKSQQETSAGPQRVGKHTCIICMESYTNLTTTVCGHPFCHECLTQALMAGEKNSDNKVGSCPVCRKQLKRHSKATTMVPILFMQRKSFQQRHEKTDLMHFQ